MAATGRPTKLDDIKAQRILDAIKGGSSRACAAGLVGVAVSTLYASMAANPEFLERVRAADAHAEQQVVDALFRPRDRQDATPLRGHQFWLKTRRARTWREMPATPPKEREDNLDSRSEEELVRAVLSAVSPDVIRAVLAAVEARTQTTGTPMRPALRPAYAHVAAATGQRTIKKTCGGCQTSAGCSAAGTDL
jgi:hypothetical protein